VNHRFGVGCRQGEVESTVRNVTDSASARRATAAAEHRHQQVLANAVEGYHIVDADGMVLEAGRCSTRRCASARRAASTGRIRSATLPRRLQTVAEDTGAIVEIGAWVIAEAVGQLGTWDREHGREALWITVSCRSMCSRSIVRSWTGSAPTRTTHRSCA
jgi:predicted signal transduction protein with EAL and GGDEF domain